MRLGMAYTKHQINVNYYSREYCVIVKTVSRKYVYIHGKSPDNLKSRLCNSINSMITNFIK